MRTVVAISIVAAATLLMGVQAAGLARTGRVRTQGTPFAKAVIFLEFNYTDEDVGVHIQTDHGIGLREETVISPDGRIVAGLSWRTRPPLGLTELNTESAEPDAERALRAYPEGTYRFNGWTIHGDRLFSTAVLSHELLPAPEITYPADGADDVPTTLVTATWNAMPGAVGYIVEFEADVAGGVKLETRLPASSPSFSIPEGMLEPGTPYKIGVAGIHANGNLSLAAIGFETAP